MRFRAPVGAGRIDRRQPTGRLVPLPDLEVGADSDPANARDQGRKQPTEGDCSRHASRHGHVRLVAALPAGVDGHRPLSPEESAAHLLRVLDDLCSATPAASSLGTDRRAPPERGLGPNRWPRRHAIVWSRNCLLHAPSAGIGLTPETRHSGLRPTRPFSRPLQRPVSGPSATSAASARKYPCPSTPGIRVDRQVATAPLRFSKLCAVLRSMNRV